MKPKKKKFVKYDNIAVSRSPFLLLYSVNLFLFLVHLTQSFVLYLGCVDRALHAHCSSTVLRCTGSFGLRIPQILLDLGNFSCSRDVQRSSTVAVSRRALLVTSYAFTSTCTF